MCFIPTVAKQAHVAQRDARPEGQSREGVKPIEQHGFTLVDFHARQNGAALLQVGCEDTAGRGDRCFGAFPHDRACPADMMWRRGCPKTDDIKTGREAELPMTDLVVPT